MKRLYGKCIYVYVCVHYVYFDVNSVYFCVLSVCLDVKNVRFDVYFCIYIYIDTDSIR